MHVRAGNFQHLNQKERTMKKMLVLLAAIATIASMTSCTSLRTPTDGPNNKKVWYNTVFGISIESAVYGDGILVK